MKDEGGFRLTEHRVAEKEEKINIVVVDYWLESKGSPIEIANEGIWALPVRVVVVVGGSQPLPGWVGATFLGRICLILGGLDPCPDG